MATLSWSHCLPSASPAAAGHSAIAGGRAGLRVSSSRVPVSVAGLELRSQLWGCSMPQNRSAVRKALANSRPSTECSMVRKVNSKQLDELLLGERKMPMVIDFYATWCGPCILLAQELEKLALEYNDQVMFLKVDTDEEHELAMQLEIRGLPTMVFVSHDKSKNAIRTEGLLPEETIREIIEKEL